MDEIKVSQLPSASQINDADLLMIIQNNTNKKVPASEVANIPDVNNHSVVVSPTEPSGSARKKVWKQFTGNLYDVNNITEQRYIESTNGSIGHSPSWCITDYMNVVGGEKLTINGNSSPTIGSGVYGIYYDSSKNVVSSITYADYKINGTILTVPSGASYVRLSVPISEKDTFKVYVEDKEYILNDNDEYEEFNPNVKIIQITAKDMLNGAAINDGWSCLLSKTGHICHLQLGFIPNTTSALDLLQLPVEFRPSKQIAIPPSSCFRQGTMSSYQGIIFTTGMVRVQVQTSADVTWNLNMTWTVD